MSVLKNESLLLSLNGEGEEKVRRCGGGGGENL